jgi:hypothetical protein
MNVVGVWTSVTTETGPPVLVEVRVLLEDVCEVTADGGSELIDVEDEAVDEKEEVREDEEVINVDEVPGSAVVDVGGGSDEEVAEGIRVASEGGKVVCPEVKTAQAPATTTH